jgi:hypothetical protein
LEEIPVYEPYLSALADLFYPDLLIGCNVRNKASLRSVRCRLRPAFVA